MDKALLGIFVEDMETVVLDCDLDAVAGASGRAIGNAGNKVDVAAVYILKNFSAHKLGYVDVGFNDRIRESGHRSGVVMQTFGTDADNNVLADIILDSGIGSFFGSNLEISVYRVVEVFRIAELRIYAVGALLKKRVDEVHLRSADEAGDKEVGRIVVEVLRSVDLLDKTVLHNDYSGRHGHSLDLVMGNIKEGSLETLVNLGKLGPHLGAELSVKVGERLVKKEYLRLTDDCAAESNTLLLSAGESLRAAIKQVDDVENTGSFLNAALDLFLRSLAELKSERHVVENGHVRIKSVVLEDHRDIAVLRGNIVHQLIADEEFAFGDLFETGDHSQSGGFAASGRANENQEFLITDFESEVGYGGHVAGIFLIKMLER